MTDHAMSSEDKLMFVSRQLDALQVEQDANAVQCPYCGKVTIMGNIFCCRTMVAAVEVLLDARDKAHVLLKARGTHALRLAN